ncbi:MAG: substrate-binding domain-containing protein [Phycisphaerae bacterium]
MQSQRSFNAEIRVAVLAPLHLSFARSTLYGIAKAARAHLAAGTAAASGSAAAPWNVMVLSSIANDQDNEITRPLREFKPDAILARMDTPMLRAMLLRYAVPTVELFQTQSVAGCPGVSLNEEWIGRLAAEHFLDRGFEAFAIFGDMAFAWSQQRSAGLKKALAAPETDADVGRSTPRIVAEFGQAHTAPSHTIAQWLSTLPRPVAVFATNDLFAARLLAVARTLDIRVPDELAVLGVDDDEFLCLFSSPPLSSVQTGLEHLGAAAVGVLERLLAGETVAPQTVVPPRGVITRQSTDMLAVQDTGVAAAIKFIRQRRDTRITVDDVARQVALNRRVLERKFTQVLGRSILHEIHRARAERIKELLRTDLSQEQIAYMSEFSSAQRMVRLFKQVTGITPGEYRHLHGKL